MKLKIKALKLQKIETSLLFLTLLFLPTQLGKHFWPDFSYVYSLKVDYLSPTIYFWDILVIGLIVVWLLTRPKINKLALNLWLFFLLTQFVSIINPQNLGAGLVRLEQYMVVGLFGVYLASSDFKKISKQIFLPFVLGMLGESVVAILQFIKGGALGLWILGERTFTISTPGIAKFDFYSIEFLRSYATFPHPNVLAAFILIVISILYPLKGRQRVVQVLAVLGSFTIFLTMSRTAILAGLVAALFLVKNKWRILTIVLFLIISPVLFTRFSSLLNFDNLALLRREELIGSAWQLFLHFPIFGVGLNNFIPAMANNLITGPSRFLQPVHNIFMLSLSETGIVGFAGLLFLIGYPIRKLVTCHTDFIECPRQSRDLSLITLLPWLIIIFLGMFDHYFLTLPQGYRLLFLVWGLSFSALSSRRRN